MQNRVHLHPSSVCRKELSPCLSVCLYGMGRFFPADKKYLVSQKDLISSLRGLSAGLWGQALLGG